MLEFIARLLRPLLESSYVLGVRRNHALEHATIHLLNRQGYRLSGVSSGAGFIIYGDVPTEKLEKASHNALKRLNNGEKNLAIHPNCGTNLVVAGLLLAGVGALGFVGTNRRSAWERFPVVMVGMMVMSLYSLPIGLTVQKHITTTSDMGDLDVVRVKKRGIKLLGASVVVHEVITQ